MKIADLFVGLGVKGGDTAKKSLEGVKSGLGEVKSMGLEAKAMIAAVVYGLERMMSQSAQTGTNLANFTALTGISAKNLQQWQFAARQAGVSGEELAGSLKAVQGITTNALLGKGAPEGWAMVANKVHLDEKRMRDTLYVMKKLQEFAQTVPQDVGNSMLKSFGISEGTISAMRRNAFTDQNFKNAPTYSDNEVSRLSKVDVAWSNLGQKIQMAFGHLTAKEGLKIVGEISQMSTEVIKLVAALTELAEKIKIFAAIGKVFEVLGLGVKGTNQIVNDLTGGRNKNALGSGTAGKMIDFRNRIDNQVIDFFKAAALPETKPSEMNKAQQNINVNQTLQFQHEGKDAKKTGESVHKAVKDAYRQMSAQGQGS